MTTSLLELLIAAKKKKRKENSDERKILTETVSFIFFDKKLNKGNTKFDKFKLAISLGCTSKKSYSCDKK